MPTETDLTKLAADIVASFVSNNHLRPEAVPALLVAIHTALTRLDAAPAQSAIPAVPIEDSITRDYIVCLNDGRKLRTLKRYLLRKFGLTPDAYRALWGLPPDYPMAAPGYTELRSEIARRGARQTTTL